LDHHRGRRRSRPRELELTDPDDVARTVERQHERNAGRLGSEAADAIRDRVRARWSVRERERMAENMERTANYMREDGMPAWAWKHWKRSAAHHRRVASGLTAAPEPPARRPIRPAPAARASRRRPACGHGPPMGGDDKDGDPEPGEQDS
jgi:hypothetical protein